MHFMGGRHLRTSFGMRNSGIGFSIQLLRRVVLGCIIALMAGLGAERAFALTYNVDAATSFGTCNVQTNNTSPTTSVQFTLGAPSYSSVNSGGSYYYSAQGQLVQPIITTTFLSACVAGSNPSEFIITKNIGATGFNNRSAQTYMGIKYTFRSANYEFALSGASSTAIVITNPAIPAPPVATSITAKAGATPQSAVINTAFANPLAATVTDQFGNGMPGVAVTFTAPSSGASGTLGTSSPVITNSSGVASTSFTANATVGGPYTVTASAGALNTSFALSNTIADQVITFGANPGPVQFHPIGQPRRAMLR